MHWYRYEYQATCGSIHCHGTAKLKNDPGLCSLAEKALEAHMAQIEHEDIVNRYTPQQISNLISEGEEASQTLRQYVDWLLTTSNPQLPDETWTKPINCPSQTNYCELDDSQLDTDYANLVNTVQ